MLKTEHRLLINQLHLRKATYDDLDDIMRFETRGFSPGNQEERSVYEERIATFAEGAWISEYDRKPVGCIFSEIWCTRDMLTSNDFELGHSSSNRHDPVYGTELYISSMTIDPIYRGQKFGFQLFNGCIQRVSMRYPQINSALLLVNEHWVQAHDIYKASKFHEVMRVSQFFVPYPDVYEDGIVMRKKLT
ncbi:MAG: GNAT family N-acetyltransferase [Pseudomonadota bacterium]